jgi:hypothetical protein
MTVVKVVPMPGPAGPAILTFVSVPATPTSSGTTGQVAKDNTYLYVCTGTNTWKRVAWGVWA